MLFTLTIACSKLPWTTINGEANPDAQWVELADILNKIAEDAENHGPENLDKLVQDSRGRTVGVMQFFSSLGS